MGLNNGPSTASILHASHRRSHNRVEVRPDEAMCACMTEVTKDVLESRHVNYYHVMSSWPLPGPESELIFHEWEHGRTSPQIRMREILLLLPWLLHEPASDWTCQWMGRERRPTESLHPCTLSKPYRLHCTFSR